MQLNRFARTMMTASAFALAASGAAHAKAYYLQAQRTVINYDGTDVPMWAYAECDSTYTTCGEATVPGPALTVKENQNLVVWVRNELTVGDNTTPVPFDGGMTSFTVSGMRLVANQGPVFWGAEDFDPAGDAAQPRRVRSMTHETAFGAQERYLWRAFAGNANRASELKPGTYIYHSATHPAVQVQMGLYGPLTVLPATNGDVYPLVQADASADIFYSEVDANFHNDVDSGNYDPSPASTAARTSAIDYLPTHYLVNGKPKAESVFAPTLDDPQSGGTAGGSFDQTTLVRFRSAALRTHVPMVTNGEQLDIVAETAEPYYFPANDPNPTKVTPRRQSTVLLPALTTADAILVGGKEGGNLIVDRALGGSASGNMNTFVVTPDNVIALNPACNAAGRLNVRIRSNSQLGANQTIMARVSNGTGEVLDIASVPHQTFVNNVGMDQFRTLLTSAESAPFCGTGTETTILAVSGSGGSHARTRTMP